MKRATFSARSTHRLIQKMLSATRDSMVQIRGRQAACEDAPYRNLWENTEENHAGDRSGEITQVSLLPPPWDELTTSDPFLSATRVSPPGSTKISFP